VGYAYNPVGDTTVITYPSGVAITQTYDARDRQRTLTDWLGHTTTFSYEAAGNLVGETLPNTTSVTMGYDAANRVVDITDLARGAPYFDGVYQFIYHYGRDALGRVSDGRDPASSGDVVNTYDALGQLHSDQRNVGYSFVDPQQLMVFGVDGAQNLHSVSTSGSGQGQVHGRDGRLGYDAAHQLTTFAQDSTPAHGETLGYNGDGDRMAVTDTVGSGSAGYGYDQAERLISATTALTTTPAAYRYDGDGLRQGKTVNGTTTAQTWDPTGVAGATGLPQLLQDGSTRYLYGPDGRPLEQIDGSGAPSDQQGSTRLLLDGTGRELSYLNYDPYGDLTQQGGSSSTPPPFGYAGQYTDAETGLQYLRARYYDPTTAQFISRDPLAALTGQPYAYAGANPLNASDPSGQLCIFGVHVPGTLNDCPGSGQGAGSAARVGALAPGRVDPLNPDTAARTGLPSWGSVDGAVLVPLINCPIAGVAYPGPGGLGGGLSGVARASRRAWLRAWARAWRWWARAWRP